MHYLTRTSYISLDVVNINENGNLNKPLQHNFLYVSNLFATVLFYL